MTLDDIEVTDLELSELLPGNDIEKSESIRGKPPYTGEVFVIFKCESGLAFDLCLIDCRA